MSPSPAVQRKLSALAGKHVNFDPDALDMQHPPQGWNVDDRWQSLPSEAPGEPVAGGSWEIARWPTKVTPEDPKIVSAIEAALPE